MNNINFIIIEDSPVQIKGVVLQLTVAGADLNKIHVVTDSILSKSVPDIAFTIKSKLSLIEQSVIIMDQSLEVNILGTTVVEYMLSNDLIDASRVRILFRSAEPEKVTRILAERPILSSHGFQVISKDLAFYEFIVEFIGTQFEENNVDNTTIA
jgi:hypothetical protein